MPRLIDGIVVDDDSTSTARVSMDEGALTSSSPLHGAAECVEQGDIAGCVHLSGVRTRAEDDLSNPRHPDYARKLCKTITSKQETRELIREVVRVAFSSAACASVLLSLSDVSIGQGEARPGG